MKLKIFKPSAGYLALFFMGLASIGTASSSSLQLQTAWIPTVFLILFIVKELFFVNVNSSSMLDAGAASPR